eukprot:Em0022g539a
MFSKLPRFKETVSDLPPVGTYDVKLYDSITGPTSFDKSGRFQQSQDAAAGYDSNDSSSVDGSSPAPSVNSGPIKPVQRKSSTNRKGPSVPDASAAKIAELQKEIRLLISERNDLDSKLTSAKQDITRLEGRLQQTIKDKLSLQAQTASLTKHNHDLVHGHLVKTSSSAQDAKRTAAALSSELELARQQLELNQEELQRLTLEAESSARLLEEERSRSQEKTTELAQQLQGAVEARIAGELRITELQSAVSVLEESNQSLEGELMNSQQCLEARQADLKATSAELEKRIENERSLEGQVKELQTSRDALQSSLDTANKITAEQASKISLLEQTIVDSSQEVQLLRETTAGLEGQLSSAHSDLLNAKGDIERQERDHLSALETLTRKCASCEEELAQERRLHRENQAILKAQVMSMEVSRKAQDDEAQKVLQDCQALRAKLDEEEVEKSALRSQVEKLSLEAAEKEEHFRTHLKEVLNISEELKVSKSHQQSELTQQLKQMSGDYQNKLQRLEDQLHAERQTVLTLQAQLISAAKIHKEQPAVQKDTKCIATQTPAPIDELVCKETHMPNKALEEAQHKLAVAKKESSDVAVPSSEEASTRSDLMVKIAELEQEIERLQAENKQLKEEYAILEEKYRPYRDKLDALEELNQLLKSQTALAQSEAEKVSDQYAKLLGHQNSRQKIMHVKKLKDENAALKLEVTELKSEIARHKKTIKRMEEEGPSPCVKEAPKAVLQTKDPSKTLLPKN